MLSDLDRYYTPEGVARSALERATLSYPTRVCADSTCGTGRLLHAANDVFGPVQCIGIDRDRKAIASLRQKNPNWILTVGDLLSERSYGAIFSKIIPKHVDLLVLNPPFSHGKRKFVAINFRGNQLKGSVAMAHLLKSFEIFSPTQGAIVIVPESLLYSETDFEARSILAEDYSVRKIVDLESCTFRGARAHASIVQISSAEQEIVSEAPQSPERKIFISITRGGLPVHIMNQSRGGVPYVHSTDIRKVVTGGTISCFRQTQDIAEGRIIGWSILIPRVGMPKRDLIRAVKIENPVQLSDCVIALEFTAKAAAKQVERRILASWDEFRKIYRGTGARYLTLSRLRTWLASRSVCETRPRQMG